ncbi:MAG: carbonic anhydrase family protein [Betaproteobacteria bacterium]
MTDSAPRLLPVWPAPTAPLALSGLLALRSLSALIALSSLAGPLQSAEPTAKPQNPASPAVAPAPAAASPAAAATTAAAATAEAAAPVASAARGPAGMRTPYRLRKPGPIGASGASGAGGAPGAPAGTGASFGAAAPISPGAPGTPAAASGEPLLGTPIKLGPGDPLERLRERLARGVALDGAAKPGSRGTPEIKVDNRASGEFLIKAPPAGATAAARPSRTGSAASRGSVVAGDTAAAAATGAEPKHGADALAGAHGPAWGYSGSLGPQTWASLNPSFSLCGSGQRQSPVDIRDGLPVDLEEVDFQYRPGFFSVTDNGHTVQVQVGKGNAIEVGARRYELMGFHFHLPGEERVDGRSFAMSIHLVHRDPQGRLAVVALVADEGPEHPAVQAVWNNLPLERGEFVAASVEFDPMALLPARRGYYTYMGSLTTPPCTEGVLWIVMQQPIQVSPQQLAIFARLHPMNARPVQPLNGRVIKQSR